MLKFLYLLIRLNHQHLKENISYERDSLLKKYFWK